MDSNSNAISVESHDHNCYPAPAFIVLICASYNAYGCEVRIARQVQNPGFADGVGALLLPGKQLQK